MTGDEREAGGEHDASDGSKLADGRYTAVLDRFETTDAGDEGGEGTELAVLLLESDDEVVAERAIPRWRLPEDARQPDAVLALSLKNGYVVSVTHEPAEGERRTSEAQSRFDRLAERPDDEPKNGK